MVVFLGVMVFCNWIISNVLRAMVGKGSRASACGVKIKVRRLAQQLSLKVFALGNRRPFPMKRLWKWRVSVLKWQRSYEPNAQASANRSLPQAGSGN